MSCCVDGAEVGLFGMRVERDAEQFRLGDDVLDRLQLGHVERVSAGIVRLQVVGRHPLAWFFAMARPTAFSPQL